MLIDSHAHINDKRFNAEQIVADMQADGLEKIISVGYDLHSSVFNLNLAKKHKNIYAAVGVHPNDVKTIKDGDMDKITEMARHEKVVAIGEIGLDYHYPDTDKEKQNYWLNKQLEIVKESKLPAIIHLRDAYEDFNKVLSQKLSCFRPGAVMHCFSGSKESALYYASLGFYISFSGAVTFNNAFKFAEIIKAVPRDLLLIETDCPYLTPEPFRGKLNYPRYVKFVAQKIAEILNEPYEYIVNITAENTYRLFSKMKKD